MLLVLRSRAFLGTQVQKRLTKWFGPHRVERYQVVSSRRLPEAWAHAHGLARHAAAMRGQPYDYLLQVKLHSIQPCVTSLVATRILYRLPSGHLLQARHDVVIERPITMWPANLSRLNFEKVLTILTLHTDHSHALTRLEIVLFFTSTCHSRSTNVSPRTFHAAHYPTFSQSALHIHRSKSTAADVRVTMRGGSPSCRRR